MPNEKRALMWVVLAFIIMMSTSVSAQTCTDKVKNGLETDVDCGGGSCPACLTARGCLANTDCLSAKCTSGKCQEPAECYNKVKDRRETDTDCGGGECYAACFVGKRCAATWDCRSKICTGGVCVAAVTCANVVVDGLETALNCGGGACPACASGQRCSNAADCRTGVCTNGLCVAPSTCSNGVLDVGEGDVDCGGLCPSCGTSSTCKSADDCLSGTCTSGRCDEAPYCFDGVHNGLETDVDCGGGCCHAACSDGTNCIGRWDCKSRICLNGVCVPTLPSPSPSPAPPNPSCMDGILNNDESAVDCGGPNCPPCNGGLNCYRDEDCGSNFCIF